MMEIGDDQCEGMHAENTVECTHTVKLLMIMVKIFFLCDDNQEVVPFFLGGPVMNMDGLADIEIVLLLLLPLH